MTPQRLRPTLAELIEETDELSRHLETLRARYIPDPKVVTEQNRPIRMPRAKDWRPFVGEPLTPQMTEVIEWDKKLNLHLENLRQFFVDWRERPDLLGQLPLLNHPRASGDSSNARQTADGNWANQQPNVQRWSMNRERSVK